MTHRWDPNRSYYSGLEWNCISEKKRVTPHSLDLQNLSIPIRCSLVSNSAYLFGCGYLTPLQGIRSVNSKLHWQSGQLVDLPIHITKLLKVDPCLNFTKTLLFIIVYYFWSPQFFYTTEWWPKWGEKKGTKVKKHKEKDSKIKDERKYLSKISCCFFKFLSLIF